MKISQCEEDLPGMIMKSMTEAHKATGRTLCIDFMKGGGLVHVGTLIVPCYHEHTVETAMRWQPIRLLETHASDNCLGLAHAGAAEHSWSQDDHRRDSGYSGTKPSTCLHAPVCVNG